MTDGLHVIFTGSADDLHGGLAGWRTITRRPAVRRAGVEARESRAAAPAAMSIFVTFRPATNSQHRLPGRRWFLASGQGSAVH